MYAGEVRRVAHVVVCCTSVKVEIVGFDNAVSLQKGVSELRVDLPNPLLTKLGAIPCNMPLGVAVLALFGFVRVV